MATSLALVGLADPDGQADAVFALETEIAARHWDKVKSRDMRLMYNLRTLAAFEAFLARTTKARIDRKPGAPPLDPLAVARYVVLAKASSPAGAIFSGLYGGTLVWLVTQIDLTHARHPIERRNDSQRFAGSPPN